MRSTSAAWPSAAACTRSSRPSAALSPTTAATSCRVTGRGAALARRRREVEVELGELAHGDAAIDAQVQGEEGLGLGIGAQAEGGELLVHRAGERAALLAPAGDRGGVRRRLEQAPERRGGAELAGIDHHQRRERGEIQERPAGAAQLVARLAHAHHPAAAAKAQRARLVEQQRGLARAPRRRRAR